MADSVGNLVDGPVAAAEMDGDFPSYTHFATRVLKAMGGLAAMSALIGAIVPSFHAASSDEIQVALVGCGWRGSSAAMNVLGTSKIGPIKLVAMADAYADRLRSSYNGLSQASGKQVDVHPARRFVGFDAYRKVMELLKLGDMVILTICVSIYNSVYITAIDRVSFRDPDRPGRVWRGG